MADNSKLEDVGFFRIKQILTMIPVCEAGWWEGCRQGIYPRPYRITSRVRGWKKVDILELIDSFEQL